MHKHFNRTLNTKTKTIITTNIETNIFKQIFERKNTLSIKLTTPPVFIYFF